MEKSKSFCQFIKLGTEKKCGSIFNLNSLVCISPDRSEVILISICEVCCNTYLKRLLRKEEVQKETIEKRKEDKFKFIKAHTGDAINGLREIDKDIQDLQKELNEIRFKECRLCSHLLNCLINDACGNQSLQKWLVIATSNHNTFRHAFHIHIKCINELLARCGQKSSINIINTPMQTTLRV